MAQWKPTRELPKTKAELREELAEDGETTVITDTPVGEEPEIR